MHRKIDKRTKTFRLRHKSPKIVRRKSFPRPTTPGHPIFRIQDKILWWTSSIYCLCLVASLTKDIIKFHPFTHVPDCPTPPPRLRQIPAASLSSSEICQPRGERERQEKCSARRAQIKFSFCLSIYNWSNLYKNLSCCCFPPSILRLPSPSMLMCTWIWQCHVNLIKLNEWRHDERSKNKQKTFFLLPEAFNQCGIEWRKRLKQKRSLGR